MHIAFVTTYPPSKGTLNEYAYYVIQALAQKPEVTRITIIADRVQEPENALPPKVRVERVWTFGSIGNALAITRALRRARPDIVWFNLQFSLFGSSPLSATLGLMTPLLCRLSGLKTVVLMHNIMETTDLATAVHISSGLMQRLYRLAGTVVTRALLSADLVTTTLPRYVEILRSKYHVEDVVLTPHGAFVEAPPPHFDERTRPTLMTFGKFGTYKRVEVLIEAYRDLRESGVACELVIAGGDSPNSPGYLDGLKVQYADVPDVTFTGYVPEEDVTRIFTDSSVVVLPYTSTTGSSGVLHQAGQYGKPVIMPNIGDLAELVEEEGFGAVFFEPEDVQSLTEATRSLLEDPAQMREMGMKNYVATRGLTVSEVIDWYLLHFQVLLGKT